MSVKVEPPEIPEKKSEAITSIPEPPPLSLTVKTEVKKEEPEEENRKEKDEEDGKGGPFTKMTMRLRRNINNPQCVSHQEKAPK